MHLRPREDGRDELAEEPWRDRVRCLGCGFGCLGCVLALGCYLSLGLVAPDTTVRQWGEMTFPWALAGSALANLMPLCFALAARRRKG